MDDAGSKFKFFFNQSAHFHRSISSFRNFSFSSFSVALKKCTVNKSIICSSIILGRSPRSSSSSSLCRNGFKDCAEFVRGKLRRAEFSAGSSHRNTPCVEHVSAKLIRVWRLGTRTYSRSRRIACSAPNLAPEQKQ